jgi:hypothetical protein
VHDGRVLLLALVAACTPVEPEGARQRAPSPDVIVPVRTLERDEAPVKPLPALGIGPCDEYRERYGRCIDTLPEAVRPPLRDALDETWNAWTEAARGPAVVELPMMCLAAIDAVSNATRSLGCEWPGGPQTSGRVRTKRADRDRPL